MSEQHDTVPQTDHPEANGKETVASAEQQQLESLRLSHPTLARRVQEGWIVRRCCCRSSEAQCKPRSGFGRLKQRHHRLIAEHTSLQAEFHAVRKELTEWRSMYLQLKADLEPLVAAPRETK